jgi:hypothetical protein
VSRVLYAIENGGFSGAIMPQNVVVGQDAVDVAEFVAKYAGRQAPRVPGATICTAEPIGSISPVASIAAASGAAAGGATGASGPTGPTSSKKGAAAAKAQHGKSQRATAKRKP